MGCNYGIIHSQNPINYIFSFVILVALIPGVGSQLQAEGSRLKPLRQCANATFWLLDVHGRSIG